MKKSINFLLLLLVTNISVSQTIKTETKTVTYADGKAFFKVCTDNPKIEFDEELEYRWYNEYSGLQKSEGGAGGQLLHGNYQAFDDKGVLRYENNYYLGLQDGVQKEWDNEGNLIETYKYKKGERYYSKFKTEKGEYFIEWIGDVLSEGSIKNVFDLTGTLISKSINLKFPKTEKTFYYYNGQINEKYVNSPLFGNVGEYTSYYRNGNIKVTGNSNENGTRVGDWNWYNEDGTLDSTDKYRISKIYFDDGKLKEQGGEYFDPENEEWIKNGIWIFYKEDGENISDIKRFEYGEEVEIKKSN